MKTLIGTLVVGVFLVIQSCDISSPFNIENTSNYALVTTLSYDYPSLRLPPWDSHIGNIGPGQDGGYGLLNSSWDGEIHKNSKDTLILFFIRRDTLEKYGYNQKGYEILRAKNSILARKFITLKNVKDDGTIQITFP